MNSTDSRMMFYCQAAVDKHPSRRSGLWTKWIIQFCTYSHFKMLRKFCYVSRYAELHLSPNFYCYLRRDVPCSGRDAFLKNKCFDFWCLLIVCHALCAHLHVLLHLMRQSWTCETSYSPLLGLVWFNPVKLHWLCSSLPLWRLWAAHDFPDCSAGYLDHQSILTLFL